MNKSLVERWMMLFLLCFSPLWWSSSFAAQGPQTFTLDGRIKQAGTTTPILDPSVKIEVHVMDPSRDCVLYAEEQFVNTQTSNGYFNIAVGSNVGAGKRIGGVDPGLAMATVFQNTTPMAGTNVAGQTCPGGGIYTPAARDSRYFRIFVTPSSTAVTDQLDDIILDAVPTAMVAETADRVGSYGPADLLRVNNVNPQVLTQANLETVFTTSNYAVLTSLLAGTSTLYNRPASNGTNVLPTIAAPAAPAAGQIWYNAGNVYFHDGAVTRTISTGSSTSVSAADGTAAAPTISFASDTNTGWYLAAPDNLAAATGGVERVRINENGNLGIGSSAPGARLTLGGDMSAASWQAGGIGIRQNSANYTDTTSSGTVGFNYVNAFGVPTLIASSATTYTNASSFSLYPPVPGANVTLTNSTGLTINSQSLVGGGGVTNGYGMQVNAPTGATNNYSATFMGGNVGIGTTAPNSRLTIAAAGSGSSIRITRSDNTAQGLGIAMFPTGALSLANPAWSYGVLPNSADFNISSYDGALTRTWLAIKTDGNVGIGVTAPTARLHLYPGTVAAGTAPLKLTAGTVMTTPEPGAIEFDGTSLFYTDSGNVRRTLGVAGAGITALTGDVTASGAGSVAATIPNDTVTFAKMQNITTQRLLGRSTAAAGDVEELTVGTGLTITGGALNLTDTTDDDSFATLLGVCGNGFVPYKSGGVWTCLEARSDLVNDTLVLRGATGSFEGNQVTANSLRLNNAGSYVSINTPAAANYTLTLPADDGTTSGQVLTTDGAGVLTWTTITPGTGDFLANGTVDMTGTLKHVAGTGALPGMTFVGDTATGIFSPSASNLGFSTGGSERMRISSTGTITVGFPGTVSTTNRFETVGNNSGVYAPSGAPETPLGGANSSVINTSPTNGAFSTIQLWARNSSSIDQQAYIGAVSNAGGSTYSPDIVVGQRSAIGSHEERIRINSAGNVGIGTTAPDTKLMVAGTLRVGDGGETCSGGNFTGGIRYNAGNLQFCDGTAWITLGTGSGSGDFLANGTVDMTGTFKAVAGTAALPGMTFVGDTNTGIYAPAADSVAITTNAMERLRINSSGNIGVGTTAPVTKFDIQGYNGMPMPTGTVQNGALRIGHNPVNSNIILDMGTTNLGTSGAWLQASQRNDLSLNHYLLLNPNGGNVGIGTTAPDTKLQVDGTIRVGDGGETCAGGNFAGGIRYNSGSLQFCDGTAWTTLGTGSGSGDFLANGTVPMTGSFKATNGASATPSITFDSDQDTGIYRPYADGLSIAAGGNQAATFSDGAINLNFPVQIDANGTAGSPGLVFANGPGLFAPAVGTLAFSTNSNERIRITSAGNVGIGNTNPSSRLQVSLTNTANSDATATSSDLIASPTVAQASSRENIGLYTSSTAAGSNNVGKLIGVKTYVDNWNHNSVATVNEITGADLESYNSSGNVTLVRGIKVSAQSSPAGGYSTTTVTGAEITATNQGSAATTQHGAKISTVANAAITTNYGLYIDHSGGGSVTNNYGVFQNSSSQKNYFAGNVGIGTTAPTVKLHVDGTLRIGNGAELCPAVGAGGLRYNGGALELCDGTSWAALGGGGGGATNIDGLSDGKASGTNVFLGASSGDGIAAGVQNLGVGAAAAQYVTSGSRNTIMGYQAGVGVTTHDDTTAIGRNSLYKIAAGKNGNTAVGSDAMFNNGAGVGEFNTGVGASVMHQGTGDYNVAMGVNTLDDGSSGDHNVAMGHYAGSASSGSNNILLGQMVYTNTSGSDNVLIGREVFQNNGAVQTAAQNVVIGGTAGGNNLSRTASNNVILGFGSARAITSGSSNVILGKDAGNTLTTGGSNILIGDSVLTPANNTNNYLNIGNTIYGNTSTGLVGIGTTAPTVRLHVAGTLKIGNGSELCPAVGAGGLRYNGGALELCDGATWTALGGGAPGADSLDFTHFADAMTLDASTDIRAPSGQAYALSITNEGTGNSFVVNDQATDTTPFVINASGMVGIRNPTPNYPLDVANGSIGMVVGADVGNSTRTDLTAKAGALGAAHYENAQPPVTMIKADSTATESIISIGGNSASGNAATNIRFFTDPLIDAGAGNERMRILANGNVGIGTTAPTVKLHVDGTLRIGSGGELCPAVGAGGLRYNGGTIEFCNGTSWAALGGGGSGDFLAAGTVSMTGNLRLGGNWLSNDGGNEGIRVTNAGNINLGASSAPALVTLTGDNTTSNGLRFESSSGTANRMLMYNYGTNSFGMQKLNASAALAFFNSAGGEEMRLDSNGRVGIGTTGPGAMLHVVQDGSAAGDIWATAYGDDVGILGRRGNGTQGSQTAVSSGDSIATFGAMAYNTSWPTTSQGGMSVYAAQNQTSSNQGTYLTFNTTANNTTTRSERIRVTDAGNVGIGTTAPDTKLMVAGTLRVGDGGETCSGGNFTGGIRYNGGNLQFCNGTAWTTLGTGGSPTFPLAGSAGSAASPTYSFSGDTDTGIFHSAADALGISAGGTDYAIFSPYGLQITNGGNLDVDGLVSVNGNITTAGRIVSSVSTDADALSAITVTFANSNMVRVTTGPAAACGTLNITDTADGGSYTVTILNANATCSTINWNGVPTNVKLPTGYAGGVAANGLVYTFIDDGATLWVSYVPF